MAPALTPPPASEPGTCATMASPQAVVAPFIDSESTGVSVRTLRRNPAPKLRVLVACEYSATVRDAFRARGFDAWSCDILPCEGDPQWHIERDAEWVAWAEGPWDLMIAHPPCNHLAASGAQYWPAKRADGRQNTAIEFFMQLHDAPIPYVAVENPVGIMGTVFRKADQIVQPWQFGDPFNKKTCFWLKGLPKLVPTDVVEPTHNWGTNSYRSGSRKLSALPSLKWGGHERSKSFTGIANAMADQWGDFLLSNPPHHKANETADRLNLALSGEGELVFHNSEMHDV